MTMRLIVESLNTTLREHVKVMPVDNMFMKYDEYIDIQAKLMPSKVMYGIDAVGRRFVAVRYKYNTPVIENHEDERVIVAFQRYKDRSDFWVCSALGVTGTPSEVIGALLPELRTPGGERLVF